MRLSLSPADLEKYVLALVARYFPDGYVFPGQLAPHVGKSLERIESCFSRIHRKYYRDQGTILFDHMNGDHFASFLYVLSNTVWHDTGDSALATRLFYLNKVMHGLDLFFSVELPEVFMLVHPLGTVLGHASYGNYLVVYQNVTVGASESGIYPRIGNGVVLYAGSTVIGDCALGDNVVVGARTFLLNGTVPAGSLVVGQYPNQCIRPNQTPVVERIFQERG